MSKSSLYQRYPWYQRHEAAVDTVVACLQIELEQVLQCLDSKLSRIEIECIEDNTELDECVAAI